VFKIAVLVCLVFLFVNPASPQSASSLDAASPNAPSLFPMLVTQVVFEGKLTLPKSDQDQCAKDLEEKTYNSDAILVQRARNFWHEYGYWRVQITAQGQIPGSAGPKAGVVVLKIEEGAQYHLSDVAATGKISFSPADLSELLLMKPGDVVTASRVQRSVGVVRGAYVNRGYSHAAVIPQIQFDDTNHTIALHLDAQSGAKDSVEVSSLECKSVVTPQSRAASNDPYVSVLAYDPHREALIDVEAALREAGRIKKNVLIEVGGDWCVWCHILDRTFQDHPELLRRREENFVTVYVNDDGQNRNEALFSRLPGMPDAPHVFVLDARGRLLTSQPPVDWEDGRGYSVERIANFMSKWSVDHSSGKCSVTAERHKQTRH